MSPAERRKKRAQRAMLIEEIDRLDQQRCDKCKEKDSGIHCTCEAHKEIMRIGDKLNELSSRKVEKREYGLTRSEYETLKSQEFSDKEIREVYDLKKDELNYFKLQNGLNKNYRKGADWAMRKIEEIQAQEKLTLETLTVEKYEELKANKATDGAIAGLLGTYQAKLIDRKRENGLMEPSKPIERTEVAVKPHQAITQPVELKEATDSLAEDYKAKHDLLEAELKATKLRLDSAEKDAVGLNQLVTEYENEYIQLKQKNQAIEKELEAARDTDQLNIMLMKRVIELSDRKKGAKTK